MSLRRRRGESITGYNANVCIGVSMNVNRSQ